MSEGPAKGVLAAMATLLLLGVAVSVWLVRIKLNLEFDPSFQSSCNFGDKLNCDLVQTSDWSTFAGHPLAMWAVATYIALLGLLVGVGRGDERSRGLHAALVVIGTLICLHSVYLAVVSALMIGTWCVFCMALYGVNGGVTLLAAWSFRRVAPLGDTLALATQRRVILPASVAFAVGMVLALPGYHLVRGQMAAARIELARSQMAHMAAAPAATPDHQDPASAQGASAQGASAQGASAQGASAQGASAQRGTTPPTHGAEVPETAAATAPAGVLTHPEGFRYSEVILRKGRSFYEVPVTDGDFALGPVDAPVTVVKFADFECGYCRALSRNMKPLREKYGAKVRWVFKHFPLDNTCNKVMKGTQHLMACGASKAANCAGVQGRFWAMHDKLYSVSLRLNRANLRRWAEESEVADMAAWDRCMDSDAGHAKTVADTLAGRFARIAGTPRTYINGHLVPGVVATEVLDYYIGAALGVARAVPGQTQRKAAEGMVQARSAAGAFWIDAWECSLDDQGRALSVAGAQPAEVSWYEASAACAKAGKRLCTGAEWVSACTGAPAIDNNKNKDFTDDAVEGSMFPYGPFHEGGRCNDDAGDGGRAVPTGSKKRCVSPDGIFDQSGNLAEWTGADESDGWLTGADFRWGAKASCMLRNRRFGLGYRNNTTGFRCCADAAVPAPASAAVTHGDHGEPGGPMPEFSVVDTKGKTVTPATLKGKVTIVSFFASWCGPCRRELPELEKFWQEHRGKGVAVLAIGVDTDADAAKRFAEELKLTFPVGLDEKAIAMGAFGVRGMPTAFVVDRQGRIARRLVGANADKLNAFKQAALTLGATER